MGSCGNFTSTVIHTKAMKTFNFLAPSLIYLTFLPNLITSQNRKRLSKSKNYLNYTTIHSMVKTSCQDDPMCMALIQELEDLSTKRLALGRRMNLDSSNRLSYLRRLRDM